MGISEATLFNEEVMGLYRHHKGGLYEVIGVGKHSENQEDLVVYVSVETEQIWLRPVGMFFETITVGGVRRRRFERIRGPLELPGEEETL